MTLSFGLAAVLPSEATAQKKWSSKAKGTVIGGVVGAATGVAVSKNNSKGAIIGGAAGAGAGYLYGRSRDKKAAERNRVVYQNSTSSNAARSSYNQPQTRVYDFGPRYGQVEVGN